MKQPSFLEAAFRVLRKAGPSTTRPLRFSIRACPMKQSFASLPGPLR